MLSFEAVTKLRESELHATRHTAPTSPFKVEIKSPLLPFHEALAKYCPPGENAM